MLKKRKGIAMNQSNTVASRRSLMSAGVGVAAAAASLHLVESSAEAATPAKGNPKAGPGEGYVTVKDGTRIY
ncbi:hypothetical protein ABTM92_20185, partial [Acinetobacter baumannii]